MPETPKVSLKKSVWKAVKVAILFAIGRQLNVDTLVSIVPPEVTNLTVGAILVGLLNYVKTKFSIRWI